MPNLLADLTIRLKDNNKFAIVGILLISDLICIVLSAITAFQFRFSGTSLEVDSRPAIAQFDYRGILLVIILSWLGMFMVSGIYRFKHANLFVLNLQLVIKISI